jgi:translation initiation factor IF-2
MVSIEGEHVSNIKISEITKKLDATEKEIREDVINKGFTIGNDDSVSDEYIQSLGLDPKHLLLDRRQEMLKKAMERHKKHPSSREVKMDSKETPSPKKISKQELMDRKKKLEKTIMVPSR